MKTKKKKQTPRQRRLAELRYQQKRLLDKIMRMLGTTDIEATDREFKTRMARNDK